MYTEFRPKHLSDLVDAIWYSDSDVDPAEGHIVPVSLGSQLVIKLYASDFETVLSGPVTRQTTYPFVEGARYFGLQFAPGVGPVFDDILLKDLKDASVDIHRILGIDLGSLAHQLHAAPSWADQSKLIATMVSKQYPDNDDFLDHNVRFAMQLANQRNGDLSISQLAHLVGISQRQLERLFLRHTGVSPKTFCTTLRLQRVLDILQYRQPISLVYLAKDCGYTDQAHLANEFRRVMGTSISTYMAANKLLSELPT